jgi:hypothetical protein
VDTATDKTDCLKITIGIDKVTNAVSDNLVLSRGSDAILISKLNI